MHLLFNTGVMYTQNLFMGAFPVEQIMLHGCNRFLKWVGLEKGNKPILGGPTLAGLPGGVVGDLQRLYPIRSNFEYPVYV